MSDKVCVQKKLENARLLKNYGSWVYCSQCDRTVGYLCYTTYEYFKYSFVCSCGNRGVVEIGTKGSLENCEEKGVLSLRKGRLCCPVDQSPLFSVVDKNIKEYYYCVICKKCSTVFAGKV